MTLEYLIYANLILATRLYYLTQDGPLSGRAQFAFTGAQFVLVALLFRWNVAGLSALALVLVMGVVSWRMEPRLNLSRGFRLIGLTLLLIVPTYAASFADGFALHSYLSALTVHLGDHFGLLAGLGMDELWRFHLVMFGALLLANEANIAMRSFFRWCGIEPKKDNRQEVDQVEYNAGRVIGILERWLMYLIILWSSDFTALAFIVAAKGIARMKQLDDRAFAEYMLIGTLLSVLISILLGSWVKGMLE